MFAGGGKRAYGAFLGLERANESAGEFLFGETLRALAPCAAVDDSRGIRSVSGRFGDLRLSFRIDIGDVQLGRQAGIAVQCVASGAEFVLGAKVIELDVSLQALDHFDGLVG